MSTRPGVVVLCAIVILAASCVAAPAVTSSDAPIATAPVSVPSAGIGGTATRHVPFGNGLAIDVPVNWSVAQEGGFLNRGTQRLVFAGNGDLASLATVPGNGDIDVASLPAGRLVLEVEIFCRLECSGPSSETPWPLDWTTATALAGRGLPADRHELTISFRWFDAPMFVMARWADGPGVAAEVAQLPSVVASIRPDPPQPSSGEFHGWAGIAPVADIPVGTVRFEPLPPGAIVQQPGRIWDIVPYFLVRGRVGLYAFVSRPLHDQNCVIHYDLSSDHFICAAAGRTYEWTRFGTYLGPEPASDLTQHHVIVRDGIVWVNYVRDTLSTPTVADEAAER